MAKQIFVTKEGLEKLQKELDFLITVKSKEVAMAIQKARAFGDLSENSEYDEAKNEQAEIEGKIAHLEETLKNVVLIDEKDIKTDVIEHLIPVIGLGNILKFNNFFHFRISP